MRVIRILLLLMLRGWKINRKRQLASIYRGNTPYALPVWGPIVILNVRCFMRKAELQNTEGLFLGIALHDNASLADPGIRPLVHAARDVSKPPLDSLLFSALFPSGTLNFNVPGRPSALWGKERWEERPL